MSMQNNGVKKDCTYEIQAFPPFNLNDYGNAFDGHMLIDRKSI